MSESKFDRIDILLKSLARNDAYIANANTKSTVALSFSAAIIAALGLNYSRVVDSLGHECATFALGFLVVFSVLSFLAASLFSLLVIKPRLDLSAAKNNFSFVDIVKSYPAYKDYYAGLKEEDEEGFFQSIAALNYNMSRIVYDKNKYQHRAINAMFWGTVFLSLALIVVVLG